MPTIWMVSAEFGTYTNTWVEGGYAAVGWLAQENLTSVHSRDEIFQRYREAHSDETPHEVGANAGQLATFILNIQPGDYVMTRWGYPTKGYRYGTVEDEPLYYSDTTDGCPFPHRRKVSWFEKYLLKDDISGQLLRNLKAARTLFRVRPEEDFLVAIGEIPVPPVPDPYRVVLDQILQKVSPSEFESLIGDLMVAMGYEDVDVVGGPHDKGVDVKGVLQSNLVSINMYVQVKCWKNTEVPGSDVNRLHGAIPSGGQGAIITTSNFSKGAKEEADKPGFPHVSLINGRQLVDLIKEYWDAESLAASPEPAEEVPSWHERLGLTQGLVIL